MKVHRPQPTFDDALEAAKGLSEGGGFNPEYERGQLELIIDLYQVDEGMDSRADLAEALGWDGSDFVGTA